MKRILVQSLCSCLLNRLFNLVHMVIFHIGKKDEKLLVYMTPISSL